MRRRGGSTRAPASAAHVPAGRVAALCGLVAFALGAGAATRAGTVVVLGTIAFIGFLLLAHADPA